MGDDFDFFFPSSRGVKGSIGAEEKVSEKTRSPADYTDGMKR